MDSVSGWCCRIRLSNAIPYGLERSTTRPGCQLHHPGEGLIPLVRLAGPKILPGHAVALTAQPAHWRVQRLQKVFFIGQPVAMPVGYFRGEHLGRRVDKNLACRIDLLKATLEYENYRFLKVDCCCSVLKTFS